ncbi:MAG TPA: alkaline phosphatase family protein [Ktedonobacterales bacterium]|nr:alkaline phosphatase family protein [Ktedonobacterales bacterium]
MSAATPAPIEHVVIIVKENHTFDNYFGTFPGANGAQLTQAPDPIADPRHDHVAWLESIKTGGGINRQYTQQDIAAYWALAQQYTLCDNYFTDVASQSEPNHLFLIAADSPVIDDTSAHRTYQPQPPYTLPSLPVTLAAAGRTWRNYADPNESYFDHIADLKGNAWNVPAAQFDTDVTAGFLPDVAWLYAPYGLSEHPGGHAPAVGPGMQWTVEQVQKVAASQLWATTAIFITWDDWGGWYDHVTPPLQSKWQGAGPKGYAGSQFRYGPRVPCLVISPYAKQQIDHQFNSHVSIVKFCLRLFGLTPWKAPTLASTDPSGDLWECFDFTAPPRLGIPSITPAP